MKWVVAAYDPRHNLLTVNDFLPGTRQEKSSWHSYSNQDHPSWQKVTHVILRVSADNYYDHDSTKVILILVLLTIVVVTIMKTLHCCV